MTSQTARSFAENAATWTPQSWWELERAALSVKGAELAHDLVLLRGPAAANMTMRTGSGGCVMSFLSMLGLAAPLVALGFLLFAQDDLLSDLLVPLALIVGVGCLIVSISEVIDRIKGRTSLPLAALAMAVLVSVPAGVSAWLIWTRVQAGEPFGDDLWTNDVLWTAIPFAAMAVLPLLLMLLGLGVGQTPVGPSRPVRASDLLDEHVRALPAEMTQAIRADISAAVDVLEMRQFIARDLALRAKTAPLGQLGATMAPAVANDPTLNVRRGHAPGGMGGTTTPL